MLTKLKIIAYSAPPLAADNLQDAGKQDKPNKLSEFEAYFNPESLSIQVGRNVKETPMKNGQSSSEDIGINQTTYSFNLVIDGTGVSGPRIPSVKAEVDKFILFAQTGDERAGNASVAFLELIWGDFYVRCQLQSCTINYTLFDPAGRALRATLNCSFAEYSSSKVGRQSTNDVERQVAINQGETLLSVVSRRMGGAAQVVDIARKNGLDSIRGAQTGSIALI